jgi:hypothetical protein
MKVVDKIESLNDGQFQVNILQEGCFIQRWCSYIICDKRISLVPVDTTKIDSVYIWLVLLFGKINKTLTFRNRG